MYGYEAAIMLVKLAQLYKMITVHLTGTQTV